MDTNVNYFYLQNLYFQFVSSVVFCTSKIAVVSGCRLQHAPVHDDDSGGPGSLPVRPRGPAGGVHHRGDERLQRVTAEEGS